MTPMTELELLRAAYKTSEAHAARLMAERDALQADTDELMTQLRALIDRMAYDGVPDDSLPAWNEARGVLARIAADEARSAK